MHIRTVQFIAYLPVNSTTMTNPAQEREEVLRELEYAVALLVRSMDARLIPLEGMSIAFAVRGARDTGGVAGVQGRINNDKGTPCPAGSCAFGTDEYGARIILTAMKFDPVMRSAATIGYSRAVIAALEDMFLECCAFSASHEPAGISSMDWGVASCCKDGVPDVIYNTGAKGKPSLIRLFGENPTDVANNIIICSNRVLHSEL
jgi:hydroxymethylpyrimidine/phosphomethylpyrimidine kinase